MEKIIFYNTIYAILVVYVGWILYFVHRCVDTVTKVYLITLLGLGVSFFVIEIIMLIFGYKIK